MKDRVRLEPTEEQFTGNALKHFAEPRPEVSDKALETVYFHIVRAEEPMPLGDDAVPPAHARVWSADDWFKLPGARMFAPAIGDWQPRNEEGKTLKTSERLAVIAGAHAIRNTGIGTWVWAAGEVKDATFWIGASGTERATLVGKVAESRETAAMRDLPGKDGYGRARGTEHLDRPDQAARITALALHGKEIAEASDIEIVRETPEATADARNTQPGAITIPELACYRDGAVRATLGPGHFNQPTVPDMVNEIATVAISRAWQLERAESRKTGNHPDQEPERIGRATMAGLIASHHLTQSAGVRTIVTGWDEHVTTWVANLKKHGPEHARAEMRRTVELTRHLEWDLQLPRNPRQIQRGMKRAAARGNERPTPALCTEPGTRTAPAQPKSMPTFSAGHVNPTPPKAPTTARDYTTPSDQKRAEPGPTR